MGPYYDTVNLHHLNPRPEDLRLLERRHVYTTVPPRGNARALFAAVMFVLAVVAYSVDLAGNQTAQDDMIQVADHSSRP